MAASERMGIEYEVNDGDQLASCPCESTFEILPDRYWIREWHDVNCDFAEVPVYDGFSGGIYRIQRIAEGD